jgi:hypothetical protein
MSKQPEPDLNEVIERLRAELQHERDVIQQVKLALSSSREFDGLSVVGGVKAVLKKYADLLVVHHK